MRKILCFIGLSIVFGASKCNAQRIAWNKIKRDKPFVATGYLINVLGEYGMWFFQPCLDSSLSVMDALNDSSFYVQDIEADLGLTYLADSRGIGKRCSVVLYGDVSKVQPDTMEYYYCRITLNPMELPKKSKECAYIVDFGPMKKSLGCLILSSYVSEVKPLSKDERLKYLESLRRKKLPLPQWYKSGK